MSWEDIIKIDMKRYAKRHFPSLPKEDEKSPKAPTNPSEVSLMIQFNARKDMAKIIKEVVDKYENATNIDEMLKELEGIIKICSAERDLLIRTMERAKR